MIMIDYIVSHSGTNDVGKLIMTANEIRANMENCLVNLKHKWPNSTIAISGLTYVPRDNNKNQLIDEINCHYESIFSTSTSTSTFIKLIKSCKTSHQL